MYIHLCVYIGIVVCAAWSWLNSPFSISPSLSFSPGNEYKIVSTPAFAESISEGDVKWDKSESINICYCVYMPVFVHAFTV